MKLEKQYIEHIVYYLKFMDNYLYFSELEPEVLKIFEKYYKCILNTRVGLDNVIASKYYEIKKINNNFEKIKLKKPNKNSTFLKFNQEKIDRLWFESSVLQISKYYKKCNQRDYNLKLLENFLFMSSIVIEKYRDIYFDLNKLFNEYNIDISTKEKFQTCVDDIVMYFDKNQDLLLELIAKIK